MKLQITNVAAGRVPVNATVQGKHYAVQIAKGQRLSLADVQAAGKAHGEGVVATREGTTLKLKYADGTTVSIENFYSVCANGECAVQLDGLAADPVSIAADTAAGTSDVVYAYGTPAQLHDILGEAAQSVLSQATPVADGVVEFLPTASSHFSPLGMLGLGALGVAGIVGIAAASGGSGGGDDGKSGSDDGNASGSGPTTPTKPPFGAPKLALKHDAGGSASDGISNDGHIKVTGVNPGNDWEYTTDGGKTWTKGTNDEFVLPEGDFPPGAIQVRQINGAGDKSPVGQSPIAIVIDKTPPTTDFDAPSVKLKHDAGTSGGDGRSNDGTMLVDGVTPGNGWEYTTDNGKTWTKGTGDTFDVPEGDHPPGTVQVRQVDLAGNTSPVGKTTTEIVIDKTPPSDFDAPGVKLKHDAGTSGSDGTSNDGTMQVSGVDPGNGWEYTTDGGKTWTKGTGDEFDLPEGSYPPDGVQVRQIDTAGNPSPVGKTPTAITIDKTPPSDFDAPGVKLKHDAGTSGSDGTSNDGTMQVSGVDPGNGWEYTTDGGKTWTQGTGDEFDLPEGNYPPDGVQVRQIDTAGNPSPVGKNPTGITIDKTPPTTDFDAPGVKLKHDVGTSVTDGTSNDGTMTVTGVTPGNGWEYTTDGGKSWTKGTGDEFDLPEGTYPPDGVQVRQIDTAGNPSPVGKNPTAITIDKTPPSDFDAPGVKLKHDAGTSGSDGTSNDGTMQVSGVDPGNGWEYTTDGGKNWTKGTGDEFDLPEGSYPPDGVQVRQIDTAGNPSPVGKNPTGITIDKTPPTTDFDAPGVKLKHDVGTSGTDGTSNDGTMTVTGVTPGNGWEYTTDGGKTWTQGTGDEFDLPEGTYPPDGVQVRQIDTAGNPSPVGKNPTPITIDKTPPSDFDSPGVKLKHDAGTSGSDGTSNDGTMQVSGVDPGNGWEYTTDGGKSWTKGTGDEFDLPEGTYPPDGVQVRQIDTAGNPSPVGKNPSAITIDKTPPTTDFDAPGVQLKHDVGTSGTDGTSNDGTMTVTGVTPGNGWEYTTDGGKSWTKGTGDEFDLPEGTYPPDGVQVRQIDTAGNPSPVGKNPTAITIDKTPPTTDFDAPGLQLKHDVGTSGTDGTSNDGTMTVAGVTPGNGWEYTTDGGKSWTPGTGDEFDLPEGSYPPDGVQVRQIDTAGNPSPVGKNPTAITIDKTPPSDFDAPGVKLKHDAGTSGSDGTSNDGTMQVSGVDPGNGWEYTTDGGNNWTKGTGDEFDLPEGTYPPDDVQVRQIDTAGNPSPVGKNPAAITIDKTPPTSGFDAPIVNLKHDAGTSESDGLSNDGTIKVSGITQGNGWEYTTDGGKSWTQGTGDEFVLPDGTYPPDGVQVRQIDTAGNPSPVGRIPTAIVIDTTPPESNFDAPVASLVNDTGKSATDGISRDGSMTVSGVTAGNTWEYSTDGGVNWKNGTGDGFVLPEGTYAPESIQVRQRDVFGNASVAGKLSSAITIDQSPPPAGESPTGMHLVQDTGESSTDGVTVFGYVQVDGLNSSTRFGRKWEYSRDGGATWEKSSLRDGRFVLPDGIYEVGKVMVRGAVDDAGNFASVSNTQRLEVAPIQLPARDRVQFTFKTGDSGRSDTDLVTTDGTFKLLTPIAPGNIWQYSMDGGNTWINGQGDEFSLPEGTYSSRRVVARQMEPRTGSRSTENQLSNFLNNPERHPFIVIDQTAGAAPSLALKNDSGAAKDDGISTDGTVTISGLEADATWEYSVDGGVQWQAGSGNTFKLADGQYSPNMIRVRQTDVAGNVSAEGQIGTAIVIDQTASPAPAATLKNDTGASAQDGISSDGTIQVSGIAAGDTWEYSIDRGVTWQTGTGDTFTLAEGQYASGDILVRQSDLAGNTSPVGKTSTPIVIVKTPPSDFDAPNVKLKHDAGTSGSDGTSNDGTMLVSGVKPGNDWEYTTDGGKNWTKGTGDEFDLPEGTYPPDGVQVRQIDKAGNPSPVGNTPTGIVIDKTPPTNDFDAPGVKLKHDAGTSGSDGTSNDGTMQVSGIDPGNGWEYTTDGGKNWTKGTGDEFDLPEGTYPPDGVQVRQIDTAGNPSPVGKNPTALTIDKTPPSDFDAPGVKLKHDAGTSGSDGTSNDGTMQVSGVDPGNGWEYTTDGGNNWTKGTGDEFVLPEGSYPPDGVQVRQIDTAGNPSPVGKNPTALTIDKTPPTTDFDAPGVKLKHDAGTSGSDGTSNDGTMQVSGVDPGNGWEYTTDGGKSWTKGTGDEFDLPEGTYPPDGVQVRQIDTAGNPSPVGKNPTAITIDKTPPTTDFDAPGVKLKHDAGTSGGDGTSNDGTMQVSGVNPGNGWEYTTDGGNNWTKGTGDEFDLPEGTYPPDGVQVRQIDTAGNPSPVGKNPTPITIDKTPPSDFDAPGVKLKHDAGTSGSDGTSNDGTMQVSGVDPGNGWEYTTDGGNNWTKGTGDEFDLPEGTYPPDGVQVRQIDTAGNPSPVGKNPTAITIDKTPPTTDFDAPGVKLKHDAGTSGGDGTSNDGTMQVSGVDPGNGWEYTTDGGNNWTKGTGDEFDLPEGTYPPDGVQVRQIDTAGNPSPVGKNPTAITIDKTPPTTDFDAPGVKLKHDAGTSGGDGTSNDGTMQVSGVNPGNGWEYTTDGGNNWTKGTGDEFDLPEGTYPPDGVQVRQIDTAGNPSPVGKNPTALTIDKTPPSDFDAPGVKLKHDAGTSGSDGTSNDGTMQVSGVNPGNGWEYTTDGGNNWTKGTGDEFDLPEGTYPPDGVQVRQIDTAGNPSPVGKNPTALTIDKTPPINDFDAPGVKLKHDAGTSGSDGTSNDGTMQVSGVDPGNGWEYTTDGGKNWTKGTGDEFDLPEGTYPPDGVQVRQIDTAGNPSPVGKNPTALTIDKTPPSDFDAPGVKLKHDAGTSGSDGTSNDGTMQVSGVDPGNGWEYTTDGGNNWTKGTGDEFVLPEGNYPPDGVQVRQIDTAGNPSPVGKNPSAITIDKTPPTNDFDAPGVKLKHDAGTSGSDGTSNDGTMTVSGVTPGNGWEYTTDGGKSWTQGTGDEFDLPEGTYPPDGVQVRQIDKAGNPSPVGNTPTGIVIDKTPPTTDFDAPGVKLKHDAGTSGSDGTSNDGTMQVSGVDPGNGWEYTTDGGKNWTKGTGDEIVLPEGNYPPDGVQVRQIDKAGNPSPVGNTPTGIVIDKTPPTTDFDAPGVKLKHDAGTSGSDGTSNDGTMQVSGVNPGNGWEYTTDGGKSWTQGTGDEFVLPEGTYPPDGVQVRQIDTAGNPSPVGNTPTGIVIDKTPPTTDFDAPGVKLKHDAGTSESDGLSNDGTMSVSGVTQGNGWEYTTDGGKNWTQGTGDEFVLPDGTYPPDGVQVRQIDTAGNPSPVGRIPTAIVIDTTPPESNFDAPVASLVNDTGKSATDGISRDGSMTVSGVTAGNTWEYSTDNGVSWKTGTGDRFVLTEERTYAPESIQMRQHDVFGNASAIGKVSGAITLDQTPLPAGQSPTGMHLFNDAGISNRDGITFTGVIQVDGLSGPVRFQRNWEYSVDGGATWRKETVQASVHKGQFVLSNGIYEVGQVMVRGVVDDAGNFGTVSNTMRYEIGSKTGVPEVEFTLKAGDTGRSASDLITRDGTFKLLTPISEGNIWQYTIDGGKSWIAGTGDEFTLAEGKYWFGSVKVRQMEPTSGATSYPAPMVNNPKQIAYIVIDQSAGAAPSLALKNDSGAAKDDGISTDGSVTISGLEADAIWEYSVDGGVQWQAGSGNTFKLADGQYSPNMIRVRQTDVAGNVSAEGRIGTAIVIDQTASPAPAATLKNDTGASNQDGISSDGTIQVSGIAAGDTWEYSIDRGVTWQTGTGDTFTLADGRYEAGNIQVRQTDAAGNVSAMGTIAGAITIEPAAVDKAATGTAATLAPRGPSAPTIALKSDTGADANDGVSSDGTIQVSGLEAGDTWEYSTDGGVQWQSGTGDTFQLAVGQHAADTIQVRQSDAAGNVSAEGRIGTAIVIDRTASPAPAATLKNDTGASNQDGISSDGTIQVSGIAAGDTWEYSTDGGVTWQTGTGDTFTLANGRYEAGNIQVRQTDAAGNVSAMGAIAGAITIEPAAVDKAATGTAATLAPRGPSAPTIALKSDTGADANDGVSSDGTIQVSGLEVGDTWEYSTDGGVQWQPGTGDTFQLADGQHAADTIQVRQSGAAGNVSVAGRIGSPLTIDATAAAAPALALRNDDGLSGNDGVSTDGVVTVAGIEEGARWEYSTDGGLQWRAGSGDAFTLASGRYAADAIQVRQTDLAGNVSAVGRIAGAVVIEPPAPVVTLLNDTGTPGDGVSTDGRVKVTGLVAGNSWEYTTDGRTWQAGVGDEFLLRDGTYLKGNVQVRQIDPAGNTSAPAEPATTLAISAFGFSLGLANDLGESSTDGVTSDSRFVFNGRAGGQWQYSFDGGKTWLSGRSDRDDFRPFGATGIFEAGQIQARDSKGHTISSTQRYEILDAQMDATPVAALVHDTGRSNADHVTRDGTLKVTGGGAGIEVEYSFDHMQTWQRADGDTFVVPDGDYNAFGSLKVLQVRFIEPRSGQPSTVVQAGRFIVDTRAPDAPELLAHGLRNGVTHDGTVSVGGLEARASWEYTVDGGAHWLAGAGGDFALAVGTHAAGSVGIRQTDLAGNVSEPAWNAAPISVVTGLSVQLRNDLGAPGDGVSRAGAMQVTGVSDGEHWQYSLDGGAHWSSSFDASVKSFALQQAQHYADGMVRVRKTDAAGVVTEAQADGALDWQVLHWNAAGAQVFLLDATAAPGTAPQANVLANRDAAGQVLTLDHLSLSGYHDAADTQLHVSRSANLSFTRDGQAVDTFTLADVAAGRIRVRYTQGDNDTAGTYAHARFDVTDHASGDAASIYLAVQPGFHDGDGQWLANPDTALWGDPSGNGGVAETFAQSGQGGADVLVGGSGRDLIFGDGSGGGVHGVDGGAPGSGDDIIFGGQGDDVLFGDGFGDVGKARPFDKDGGFGGGGGGPGQKASDWGGARAGGAGGIGAGAGADFGGGGGHDTTLGNVDTTPGARSTGTGAGVGSGRPSGAVTAEVDGAGSGNAGYVFDNTGTVAATIEQLEAAFLKGSQGDKGLSSQGLNGMFSQGLGHGNDEIHGGAGNDLIMGMLGNDVIIGGEGNDLMYGCGGIVHTSSVSKFEDSDTFVWQRGDAGTQGALDVIRDFRKMGIVDHLDIRGLLEGYTAGDDLKDWVSIQQGVTAPEGARGADVGATGTLITIDVDGAGSGTVVQQIFLTGINHRSFDPDLNHAVNTGVLIV